MALYDDHLKKKISELPSSPGVYQYFDSSGVIIYIGEKSRNRKVAGFFVSCRCVGSGGAVSGPGLDARFAWGGSPSGAPHPPQSMRWSITSSQNPSELQSQSRRVPVSMNPARRKRARLALLPAATLLHSWWSPSTSRAYSVGSSRASEA